MTDTPVVGQVFTIGPERIVPTYVRPSAKPRPNGACYPGDDGWYVEFVYEGDSHQYKRYIPAAP